MEGNKERDSLLETRGKNKEISEKEVSKLAADFKKLALKGTAGGVLLPVVLSASLGMVGVGTFLALKDNKTISKEIKDKILGIGDAAQKMTQEAFDKIGIENPFKKELSFGQGRSGGAGATGSFEKELSFGGGESRGKGASGSWEEEFKFGGGESRGKGASGSWEEEPKSGSGGGEGPGITGSAENKKEEVFDGFHGGKSGGAGASGKW